MLALISSTSQHTDDGQAIRANHKLRHAKSRLAVKAFEAWFGSHIRESVANTLRSTVSTCYSHDVGFVTMDEMPEFNAWMDQCERFTRSMADMVEQLGDRNIAMSDDTKALFGELMFYGDSGKMPLADQVKRIGRVYADLYPEPARDKRSVHMLCDDQDDLMRPNMTKIEVKEMYEEVIIGIKNNTKFNARRAGIEHEMVECNARRSEPEHEIDECVGSMAEPEHEIGE